MLPRSKISIYGNKAEEPMDDIYIYNVRSIGSEKLSKNVAKDILDQKTWGQAVQPISLRNGGSVLLIIGGEKSTKPMMICTLDDDIKKWDDLKK